jgi:hypothetical protein
MMIEKKSFFERCLEDGGVAQVYVHRLPGLDLPTNIKTPTMLEYGWSQPIKIPDLTWSDQGISATLSFDQTPYATFVPWSAVVAIAPKGQGLVVAWYYNVPGSVQDEVTLQPAVSTPAPKRPNLSVVRDEA